MKLHLSVLMLLLAAAVGSAQSTVFPGITPAMKKDLAAAKRSVPFALPTWLPAGFALTKVEARVGRKVKIEDKQLVFVYSRELPDGKLQRFAFEAGFDGIGDLAYDRPRTLRTPIGKIYLYYQPTDEDGKKIADLSMTEWFDIAGTAFHYDGFYDAEGGQVAMLSLADTEKILRSLRRY